MKKNIVIVHYNTPYLTECLVRSINLFVKDAIIYIFDNSDKYPFVADIDNVLIIDNTKGEIFDFDKWLDKYKDKNKSYGRVNNWGSAKHCYSVEKCMEIIKDNFILLDSDVLLKKDISELFDENIIYAGEVITQPSSSIKRVLPFVTYINTKMCIEKGIHYFDDNYMHGLYKNTSADRYDTGASFYLNASKCPHKEINYSDYVIHYGHGSWNKKGCKQACTPNEWLSIHKSLWSTEINKKVIYTCITGDYDDLKDPQYISEGFDYVCFTDNLELKSNIWEIRPLPIGCEELSQVKKQRYVKINPHLLLNEYDISIWTDGCVSLIGDLNELVNSAIEDDISVYVPKHPIRNCIYKEAKAVVEMRKDTSDIVKSQIERYKQEGFPSEYGLLQSNILIRKHNEKDCIRLMEAWFDELKCNSHRDQLSFNYVLWKNSDIKVKYLDKNIYKSKWFSWNGLHKRKSRTINRFYPTQRNIIGVRNDKIMNMKKIQTHDIGLY